MNYEKTNKLISKKRKKKTSQTIYKQILPKYINSHRKRHSMYDNSVKQKQKYTHALQMKIKLKNKNFEKENNKATFNGRKRKWKT